VDARVTMSTSGWYSSARHDGVTYRVYQHTGTLHAAVTVTPNKHGECVRLDTEKLVNGSGVSRPSPCVALNSASKQGLKARLSSFADACYRARAVFDPSRSDQTNVGSYSGWFYFEAVK
jgi:hypothetical protein